MNFLNQHKFLILLSILFLLVACASCKKFVDIDPPKNQLQTQQVFENDQAAISAVVGLYGRLSANLLFTSGAEALYPALSADEIVNPISSTSLDPFSQNSLQATNSTVSAFWSTAYFSVYDANAVLEGLNNSTALTDSVKKQLKGEMLVVRALNYFYLINLFGDVPLVTSTNYEDNAAVGRTPVSVIYQQITKDLNDATQLLQVYYPSANKARPNKWTAAALLARVYSYQKKYSDAEAQATSIINSGNYSLPAPNAVFVSTSAETIWQLARDNNNTIIGSSFIPSSSTVKPTYAVTSNLVAAFEPGDLRKTNWLAANTISGQQYYYPFKYKSRVTSPITEYYIVFRLAEQYLIRAEARAQQGNLSGAVADINVVRARAGLPLFPSTLNATQVSMAIEQERRIELFTEGGHRWLDLKRFGKIDAVMSAIKGSNWQPEDALYPIPQNELQRNPALTQNPGY